jgi:hypothetical protein
MTTSLTRFQAYNADSKDQSGIATYTHGSRSVNVPIATFLHAQQLAAFIDGALADAARDAKRSAGAAIRGLVNTLENDA